MQNEVKRIRHQFKQYSKLVSEAMQEMCSYFQSDDFKKFKAQFVERLKSCSIRSTSQSKKSQSTFESPSKESTQQVATNAESQKVKAAKKIESAHSTEDKAFNAYKARVRNLHKNLTDDELLQKYEQYKLNKQKKAQKNKANSSS